MGESRATFVAKRLKGHRGLKMGAPTTLVESLVKETIRLWEQAQDEEERSLWYGDHYSDDS